MGLSGTLEAFPLSEVLRLLGRSGQTGRLIARSGEKEMRAYLQAGRLVIAWAGSDAALGDELIGRGLIDHLDWDDVASGAVACEQALQDGVSALDFDHAILDITIEGLAKMVDGREGTFAFEEGEVSDLRLETEVDLDAVLEGVDDRLKSWRRLRAIVPDTGEALEFVRVAAGTDVQLSDRAWNLLVQMLPRTALDDLIADSGRTSTAFIEDLLELLSGGLATIEGFTPPEEVDARFDEVEDEEDEASPSFVPDDPLASAGPTGWENELASIAAESGDDDEEGDRAIPLLEGEDADFLKAAREAEGFDFGLVGIDVGPVKGRNLLEKDDSWQGILGASTVDDEEGSVASAEPDEPGDRVPAARPILDLGLDDELPDDDPDDDLLGSVLHRLDEVLTGETDDGETEAATEADYEADAAQAAQFDDPVDDAPESSPGADPGIEADYLPVLGDPVEATTPEDALDGAGDDEEAFDDGVVDLPVGDVDEDDLLAAVAALGDADDEPAGESVEADDEDAPPLLERVAALLEEEDAEEVDALPDADDDVPYDAEVAPEADEVEDATATAEPEEHHPADDPAPGMSNLLRRRARGALAKELRSLSD